MRFTLFGILLIVSTPREVLGSWLNYQSIVLQNEDERLKLVLIKISANFWSSGSPSYGRLKSSTVLCLLYIYKVWGSANKARLVNSVLKFVTNTIKKYISVLVRIKSHWQKPVLSAVFSSPMVRKIASHLVVEQERQNRIRGSQQEQAWHGRLWDRCWRMWSNGFPESSGTWFAGVLRSCYNHGYEWLQLNLHVSTTMSCQHLENVTHAWKNEVYWHKKLIPSYQPRWEALRWALAHVCLPIL